MLDEVSIRCNPNCNKATSVKSQTYGPKSLQKQNQRNINTKIDESKSGSCISQNHTNTKMNESRSGRCIAHNHKNTEMNESRSSSSRQTDLADRQIQAADRYSRHTDSGRQTE
ncbi:hypothetical protein Tco_1361914 [Tanacetum coccineum]